MAIDPHAPGSGREPEMRVQLDGRGEHASRVSASKSCGSMATVAPMRPVETVIFDYGGVFSTPVFRNLDGFETQMGYRPGSVNELLFGEAAYVSGGGGDPSDGAPTGSEVADWHRLERGELSFAEYIDGLVARAPDVLGAPLDMGAYQRFLGEMPLGVQWPIVHRARRLQAQRLRLGLLTNNVAEFGDTWRATFPVDELFEVVVDSSAVGMRKPDPEIYLLTCERMGVHPEAAVFIDDNLDNCRAADALGIESVQFGDDAWDVIARLDAILERRGTDSPRVPA